MADRTIRVILKAEVDGFRRAMAEATKATDALPPAAERAESRLGRMVQSADRNRDAWQRAGTTLMGFGAATVGGLALATKAAIDWESAWTGVLKTVDGSSAELDAVEASLRQMARTLPASHTEIAAVAEAAGQLGVQTGNVAAFTRVMIDLGETTNLSAQEAATALARFSNIMGTSQGDVSLLGSTLVGLGNNFATTESEILDMAMRLAGAGRQMGLTEGETLGLAAAMSSVGIEAEAGGSAMSLTMKRINSEVENSGPKLAMFAQIAGMTSAEFQQAWGQDAAGALSAFVAGLSDTEAVGMSATQILTELGVTGIRESDALLRLSSASDVLTDSIAQGNREFEANNALTLEAAKRYETTEARMAMARNSINDAAITLGETFLPALANAADGVANLATWIGNLPAPLLNASAGLGAVVGATALAAGGFLTLFPRVMDTVQSFHQLNAAHPRVASGLRNVGKGAGAAAVAFIGFTAATAAVEGFASGRTAAGLEETTRALLGMKDAADMDEVFAGLGLGVDRVDGLEDALRRVAAPSLVDRVQDLGGSIRGIFVEGTTGRTATIDQLEQIGEALGLMVSQGNAEAAAEQYRTLEAAWIDAGGTAEEFADLLPAYDEAMAGVENQATLAANATEGFGDEVWNAVDAVDNQRDALGELIVMQARAAGEALSLRDAQREFYDATEAVTAALEKNGPTLDITTEAGRRNQAALDDIARAGWDLIDSMTATGATEGELRESMRQSRETFLLAAEAMGMSTEEAAALADQLGLIPNAVAVDISVDTTNATNALDQFILLASGRKVYVDVEGRQTGFWNGPGTMVGMASGGHVRGPGTATSDSIPARLSDGEYVIRAAAVQRYGVAAFDAMNAMRFASGGYVGSAPAPMPASGAPAGVNVSDFTIVAADPKAAVSALYDEMNWSISAAGLGGY